MIRDTLAALGEAALMIAALVGICILIIAPVVATLWDWRGIFLCIIAWPVAGFAAGWLDGGQR